MKKREWIQILIATILGLTLFITGSISYYRVNDFMKHTEKTIATIDDVRLLNESVTGRRSTHGLRVSRTYSATISYMVDEQIYHNEIASSSELREGQEIVIKYNSKNPLEINRTKLGPLLLIIGGIILLLYVILAYMLSQHRFQRKLLKQIKK